MRTRTRSDHPAAHSAASPSVTDLKRRRFLLTIGAASATAAATAAAATPTATTAESAATNTDETIAEYRETAHVRDYYRTAKL